jgi:hypothetical protein
MPNPASVGLACLAAAVLTAGCLTSFNVREAPKDVIDPTAIGLWQSETTTGGGFVKITLQTGASFTLDQEDRISFGYSGKTDRTTLIIVISNGSRQMYVVAPTTLQADRQIFPPGCHPALGTLVYDEPGAIVIRVTAPGGSDWLPFGLRFKKAITAELRTPPPYAAPWFGDGGRPCLDDFGQVFFIDGLGMKQPEGT